MSNYWVSSSSSGGVPSNVPINFVTNSGTAVSVLNTINILGVGGVATSGSGNTVSITVSSAGQTWTDESTDFNAVANEGYFCTATLTATLPALATQGQTISFIVDTTDDITVQADPTQFIAIGAETSTLGGNAVSTAQGDNLVLVYRSATSTWWAETADATWTLN